MRADENPTNELTFVGFFRSVGVAADLATLGSLCIVVLEPLDGVHEMNAKRW